MLVSNGVFKKKPSQKIAIPVSPFLLDSYIRLVLGAGLENIVMFKQVIQAPDTDLHQLPPRITDSMEI